MLLSPIKPGIRFALAFFGASGLALVLCLCFGQGVTGQMDEHRTGSAQAREVSYPHQSPGDCGPETYQKFLFEEHVEAGAPAWAHSGLVDLWEISSWRPHDGTFAWHAPAPAFVADQILLSPPIMLPEHESPLSFKFWHYQELENSYAGCNDGALLEISQDAGQNWTQLENQLLTDPYDGVIEAGYDNPLAGRLAWCGHPQDWFESVVALDEFAGSTVQFRFRIGTDSTQSREGWYLDDLVVQSCPSAYIASIDPESRQSGRPGEQLTHNFRIENLGLDDHYSLELESGSWPSILESSSEVTLSSGQVVTASVLVDLPAVPGGQQLEDTFHLRIVSSGNPNLTLQAPGISSLEVTPALNLVPNQDLLIGVPGEIITHTFILTNTGNTEDDFKLAIKEAGWPAVVSPNTGRMLPGEAEAIPVRVAIPVGPWRPATIAITDTFKLQVESGWSAQVSGEVTSTTGTDVFAGLRIEGPSLLDAFAGRAVKVYFYVDNLGNFADRYTLDWQGNWLVEKPPAQTDWIAAGERGMLAVTILVPPQTPDGDNSALVLKATSQLDPTRKGQIYLTIYGWKRLFLPLIRQ